MPITAREYDIDHRLEISPVYRGNCLGGDVEQSITRLIALENKRFNHAIDTAQEILLDIDRTNGPTVAGELGELELRFRNRLNESARYFFSARGWSACSLCA
jgi:hypothetical protein